MKALVKMESKPKVTQSISRHFLGPSHVTTLYRHEGWSRSLKHRGFFQEIFQL